MVGHDRRPRDQAIADTACGRTATAPVSRARESVQLYLQSRAHHHVGGLLLRGAHPRSTTSRNWAFCVRCMLPQWRR
jgi:hypothetical protein